MVHQLACQVQTYAWGKLGKQSAVAHLSSNCTQPPLLISPETPYAELWMGTHPSAPSRLMQTTKTLLDHIRSDPNRFLTPEIAKKFNQDLPFLFKVLSVNKALSIQAHPDKQLAEQLHRKSPQLYKDDNHKPEMAVALTPFEGLCGFRALEELAVNLGLFPELASVIGEQVSSEFIEYVRNFTIRRRLSSVAAAATKTTTTTTTSAGEEERNDSMDRLALRRLFTALMTAEVELVGKQLKLLVDRLLVSQQQSATVDAVGADEGRLLVRLYKQYPGDVGCFCALLLNHVCLQPGEAMFLAANEPHAYLSGDCIECMATSDNVVRAGLTPKPKDVETLVQMLTYNSYGPADIRISGKRIDEFTVVYETPIPEFDLQRITVPAGQGYNCAGLAGPSLMVVVDEDGQQGRRVSGVECLTGSVLFVEPNEAVSIESGPGSIIIFRAYTVSKE